ncbi:MAG TPA: hypothetical protein PKJ41_20730 [Bryobacteraceae bacterium]|nr:hypothetical protein [Bryobacteraceae bacterium]HPT27448.1 hypothetical protein [Bryobacteraceae bacterium]
MPRLTEQEQQEVLRFLEADKPLPDKYRFLEKQPGDPLSPFAVPGGRLIFMHFCGPEANARSLEEQPRDLLTAFADSTRKECVVITFRWPRRGHCDSLRFEDKREMEPLWDGKTSEVCNIVLPFHAVDIFGNDTMTIVEVGI